ncbi:MAG: Hsp33 family molecular chaperone [Pseudomonadota bacterium]
MNYSTAMPAATAGPDDVVLPFQIENAPVRGRVVRLGHVVDHILARHSYPVPVARLLGEHLTIATLLSGMLKYDGIFTLQVKGSGPVTMMVADVTTEGAVRGFAQYNAKAVETLDTMADATIPALLGSGYIAFTVDQGENTERYQGIVELTGERLVDSVHHYFAQSEQLDASLILAVGQIARADDAPGSGFSWRSGGLLIQRMPREGAGGAADDGATPEELEAWNRSRILAETTTEAELLDPTVATNDLLFRLFHEDGVRVYPAKAVEDTCRCSAERVERVLRAIPDDELADLKTDEGIVQVTCEFCNRQYNYDDDALAALRLRSA